MVPTQRKKVVRSSSLNSAVTRPEVGESGDELLRRRGRRQFEVNCRHVCSFLRSNLHISLALDFTHQLCEIHFGLSRLKAVFKRASRQLLEFRTASALQEKIGIVTNVLD
jgi:hypothetical protein